MPTVERVITAGMWRLPGGRHLVHLYKERLSRQDEDRYQAHLAWSMSHPEHFAADLPPRYGRGMTERAVEFGWVAAQTPAGRVLDAGSALNHRVTLDHLLPMMDELTIVTLAPEPESFPERGVRYRYEDLRSLDLPDDTFDTVVSVSTLEHVGLDNERFQGAHAAEGDPAEGARQAMRELVRVARPGALMLVTVPFGTSWRDSWVRQFDGDELDDLVATAQPAQVDEAIFRHDPRSGWRRTSRAGAASAQYREWQAEAVACVRLTLR